MKITIYELLELIKNGKAPKKIKIDGSTLFLSKIDGIRYRFEKCGSLNWDYYIETDRLDAPVEILDKDFKLEEEQDIEELNVWYEFDGKCNDEITYHMCTELKDKINELIKAVNELRKNER